MKKISILKLAVFIAATCASTASVAVEYRTAPSSPRPALIGPAALRNTVPVTTTTTTNVTVPETNITTETSETINIAVTGAKRACLSNPGNVWGDRMFSSNQGTLTTSVIPESDIPENNVCFAVVSMRSSDIPNLAMVAAPRFFQTETFIECGSWVSEQALNEAILDANKNSRIAATIVASIGGAAAGFFITDLITGKLIANRRDGAVNHTTKTEIQNQVNALKQADGEAYKNYRAAITALNAKCGTAPNLDERGPCMFGEGTNKIHVSEIAGFWAQ